ncbi:hypothetical protein D9V37_08315 [Nocardioides mangrovicus]|uniref:EfeO-type cupredoxin-like domain-containing protein n=1 Tax=Nocardioides mangrovicus TaxID=2478913 RepID=A0A3L8P443_9ACTN|nr:hypothetical protein [Nocardioides mangrovicus]RLV49881.1 hypothetical protein D9V37_08315 [Nocardioides mangrovicus]
MSRCIRLLALACAAVLLTGCGSSGGSSSTTQHIHITVKGDTVTPTNKKISVPLKKPITLTIDADAPGELHLHSSPEQHIEFAKGTTTKKITLKVPGVVELEDHATDTLIAQLEVK